MADKHTPGPWPDDLNLYTDAGYAVFKGDEQYRWPPLTGADEIIIANARLMSAAPDLLAACIAVLKAWDGGHCVFLSPEEGLDEDAIEAPFALVADAVNKATGEEA